MEMIVCKNILPWTGREKLYLKSRSSDVSFKFQNIKVPAHKCILSAISPDFDAMFYGSHKQDGDIDVVDATAEAFKEFLQIFYCSEVKLTAENLSDVMNLCRRYLFGQNQTASRAYINYCNATKDINNLYEFYELAIFFKLDDLKTFCQEEIGKNAVKIFRSSSFLNCQLHSLHHIFYLETANWSEMKKFNGCMAWAKSECVRKQCDENDGQNLRSQLGDLFHEILFAEMSLDDIQYIFQNYDGLLSNDDYVDITYLINNAEHTPAKVNKYLRRKISYDGSCKLGGQKLVDAMLNFLKFDQNLLLLFSELLLLQMLLKTKKISV